MFYLDVANWQLKYEGKVDTLQGRSMISSTNVLIRDILLVSNLRSDYGEGCGISFWTSNDMSVDKDASVSAGLKLSNDDVDSLEIPKRVK